MTEQQAPYVSALHKPDLSKPITQSDWNQLEQYYIGLINPVHIPEDPKPFDITSINSKLEKVYHEARLDYYYTSRSFEKIESSYRKLKRALWPITKGGKNAEEREHLLQNHLMVTTLDQIDAGIRQALGLPNTPVSIYALYDVYRERMDFMKTILDMVADKTSRLITDSGAMKIESQMAR